MKNIKNLCAFFALFLLIVGCVKDNSNEDIRDLNKVVISGIDPTYTTELGVPFIIKPKVEAQDNDLSYVWYIYSALSDSRRDTLSLEKDLDVRLSGDRTIPGTKYSLIFKITDNKTGTYTSSKHQLNVEATYTKGLLLLCDRGGNRELNMLKSGDELLENIFEKNNSIKLDNTIHQVAFANPNKLKPALKHVLLLGKNSYGGYVLDPISLATKKTVREMFDGNISSEILDVKNYSGLAGNIEYLIVNGKLHKRTSNMSTVPFQAAAMVPFGGSGTYSTEGLLNIKHEPIIFDNLNGRVLAHVTWNKGSLMQANVSSSSMTHFNVNNMGDISQVAFGMTSATEYWIVGRDRKTNSCTVYKFNYMGGSASDLKYATTDKVEINSTISPNFAAGHSFASNSAVLGTCFFIKENKLFALNTESISSSSQKLAEIMIKDFALEGMSVTGMEFPTVDVPSETDPTKNRKSNQLRIFVQDNSLTSLKGGVVFYEVTTSGGINIKEVSRYIGGFCDKVVDIDEKLD